MAVAMAVESTAPSDGVALKKEQSNIDSETEGDASKSNSDSCQYCDFSSTRKDLMADHVNALHERKFLYRCNLCQRDFNWQRSMREHLLARHKIRQNIDKYHTVVHANATSADTSSVSAKITSLSAGPTSVTEKTSSLSVKTSSLSAETSSAPVDGVSIQNEQNRNVSEKDAKISEAGSYSCPHCDATYLRQFRLNEHLKTHEYLRQKLSTKVQSLSSRPVRHENTQSNKQCQYCDTVVASDQTLRDHINARHDLKYLYKCRLCGFLSNWPQNIRHHLIKKHNICGEFESKRIKVDAKDKTTVIQPSSEMFSPTTKTTPMKGDTTATPSDGVPVKKEENRDVSKTEDRSRETFFRCLVCKTKVPFQTRSRAEINKHIMIRHRIVKTESINKKYRILVKRATPASPQNSSPPTKTPKRVVKTNLPSDGAAAKKEKNNAQLYPCQYCDVVLSRKNSYEDHVNAKHNQSYLYKCSLCKTPPFLRKSRAALRFHFIKQHGMSKDYSQFRLKVKKASRKKKGCPCPYCGAVLGHKESLEDHINAMHNQTFLYKCGLCKKEPFLRKFRGNIRTHLIKQHGIRKDYVQHYSKVKANVGTATTARPSARRTKTAPASSSSYSASSSLPPASSSSPPGPPASSSPSSSLASDEMVAKALKMAGSKLSCLICGTRYSRRDSLMEHINRIHAGMGFRCRTCQKVFNDRFQISHHLRKMHGSIGPKANSDYIKLEAAQSAITSSSATQ